ncbi:MAG: cytochrome-c peroxidase [Vicinamibacterales bacterium]
MGVVGCFGYIVVIEVELFPNLVHSREETVSFFHWQVLCLLCVIALVGCNTSQSDAGAQRAPQIEEHLERVQPPLGLEVDVSVLETLSPSRIRLGRSLFFDRRLSADGTISCATCHRPEHAFSERTPVSSGIKGRHGRRKAPSLVNQAAALYPHLFRDGRAATLEEQALQPITSAHEMGNTVEGLLRTLGAIEGYRPLFADAFGSTEITTARIATAIADYVRTRMSGNSPWDRWRRNHDESAVTEQVKLGHELFFGKAGCNQCHLGSNFSDSSFHNLGVGWDPAVQKFRDEGRFGVTKSKSDLGAFKTPTLREVTRHPPYMHDGSLATLRDVLDWYNRGGEQNPSLDSRIRPLHLTADELDQLEAFLNALEGEGYHDEAPATFPE